MKGNSEEQRKGILILYGVSEKGLAGEVIAAGGLKIITEAMQHHPCDEMVQNNGVKALAFFADNGWARDVAGVPQGVVSAIDSNAPIFLVTNSNIIRNINFISLNLFYNWMTDIFCIYI